MLCVTVVCLGYAFEALFGPFTAFSYLFIFILFICLYYYLCTALDYLCRLRCISLEPSDVRLARVWVARWLTCCIVWLSGTLSDACWMSLWQGRDSGKSWSVMSEHLMNKLVFGYFWTPFELISLDFGFVFITFALLLLYVNLGWVFIPELQHLFMIKTGLVVL